MWRFALELAYSFLKRINRLQKSILSSAQQQNASMYATDMRSHHCNELRMSHVGQTVNLIGWVQVSKSYGHFAFISLRDRYGITQIIFRPSKGNEDDAEKAARFATAVGLGRESVIRITGTVIERENKNPLIPTGDVEVLCESLEVLNHSKLPPFLIKDETDAKEDTLMQFRYLDIRRNPVKEALLLRNKVLMHRVWREKKILSL